MQYDVLLTYPKEKINLFHSMIPMGLASIGAVLEDRHYSVKCIDFNFYHGDFRRDLHRLKPKIVGIGGTTPTRRGSFLTAVIVKDEMPDVPVVFGGPHATFTADDTLKHVEHIDYVVRGEGEYSFLQLADLTTGRRSIKPDRVPGISYRKDGRIEHTRAKRIDNLDSLPLPARHLFSDHYHIKLDISDKEAEFLMTSRGCSHVCTFCVAARMFPGGVRYRSIPSVQKEIETILSKKDIGALKIFDSTFTVSREHVLEFCRMIKPYRLLWECEIRADTVDYDLLRIMKEAGCAYVDIGLETTEPSILRDLKKNITPGQVQNVLDWCKKLDIRTKVFFIFGHFGQSYESCKRDIQFLINHRDKIDLFSTSIGMKIFPGTAIEKKAREAGLIPKRFSWTTWRPPKWNYLLGDVTDVMFLIQEQLNHIDLFRILIQLLAFRIVGNPEHIKNVLILNIKKLFIKLKIRLSYKLYALKSLQRKASVNLGRIQE